METIAAPTAIPEKKPTSVPAIGLAIICLGGLSTFFGTIGACIFTFVDFEEILANDPAFRSQAFSDTGGSFLNMLGLMKTLSFLGIPVGIVYIIGGIYLRKFKLWANRLLCIVAAAGVVVSPLIAMNVFNMFPAETERMFNGMYVYIFIESALPAGALIWFLNSKKIRPHFT